MILVLVPRFCRLQHLVLGLLFRLKLVLSLRLFRLKSVVSLLLCLGHGLVGYYTHRLRLGIERDIKLGHKGIRLWVIDRFRLGGGIAHRFGLGFGLTHRLRLSGRIGYLILTLGVFVAHVGHPPWAYGHGTP